MTTAPSPILDALEEPDRTAVLERLVPRRLHPGESLYFSGERTRRVHVVLKGAMKLSARSGEGDEAILFLALPGDLIGDIAALDDLPQPLDAIAAAPTTVLGLDADLLVEILQRNPAAMLQFARQLGRRLRWMCDTTLERTSSEVPARLAGRLLDLADLLGRMDRGAIAMDIPLAQADLGSLAGMCRESACKTLRRFKADGLVDYRGRTLRILRPDALEKIRCAGRMRNDA